VPDSIIARLPANGGVVMVTFVGPFISQPMLDWQGTAEEAGRTIDNSPGDSVAHRAARMAWRRSHPRPEATVADLADHVEHVRRIAGIDHVAIGGDYDGTSELPVGMEDVTGYPHLFAELIRRGWTDEELLKLAGGNIVRVLREAERVRDRLAT
jgi:membrane dipeptidase